MIAHVPTALPHPIMATSVTGLETRDAMKEMTIVKTRLIVRPRTTAPGTSFLFQDRPSAACGTENKQVRQNMTMPYRASIFMESPVHSGSVLNG